MSVKPEGLLGNIIFRSWHNFLFLDNIEKIQEKLSWVLNTFEILWKMEHLLCCLKIENDVMI